MSKYHIDEPRTSCARGYENAQRMMKTIQKGKAVILKGLLLAKSETTFEHRNKL